MSKGISGALRRLGIGAQKFVAAAPLSPLFTIVVPTCDRPDALARALASIGRQSDLRCTVIIVDDGLMSATISDAHTLRFDLQVMRTSGRIGAAAARNLGMGAAQTPWIVFLDDDDEFLPEFLKNLAAQVEGQDEHPTLAITDLLVWDYDKAGVMLGERIKTFRHARTPLGHDIHQAIRTGMSGLTINRLALHQAGAMDPTYRVMDDSAWILRLVEAGTQIVFVAPAGVIVHSDASLDRLSNAHYFDERIAECRRAKDQYQTLDGRFPGLPALFDAMVTGLEREFADVQSLVG